MIFNLNDVMDIVLDIRRQAVFNSDTVLFDLTLELERVSGKIFNHVEKHADLYSRSIGHF